MNWTGGVMKLDGTGPLTTAGVTNCTSPGSLQLRSAVVRRTALDSLENLANTNDGWTLVQHLVWTIESFDLCRRLHDFDFVLFCLKQIV